MFAWHSVIYGLIMALIDTVMMSLVKNISLSNGNIYSMLAMILPMIIYSFEPWIFLSAMKYESMAIMNILWNLTSNILVTTVGIFYFGEKISGVRLTGFILAMISLAMLGYKD